MPPRLILLAVDDSSSKEALQDLQHAVSTVLCRLDDDVYLGLLSFGGAVGAYLLSRSEGVEALMFEAGPLSEEDEASLQSQAMCTAVCSFSIRKPYHSSH